MQLSVSSAILRLLLISIIIFNTSCKKKKIEIIEPTPPIVVTPPPAPTPPPPPPIIPSIEVGTGSGNLTIDGAVLDLSTIKLILVKPGTYQSISVKNITGTAAAPIVIKNNGLVNITSVLQTDNVNYVTISGNHITGITYGFNFENISYRAITVNNKMNFLTLQYLSFKNIGDYVISGNSNAVEYLGTPATRFEGLKILHCFFDNAGSISFGGNINKDSGKDNGFYKDLEIGYNIFQNTNVGSVCTFTNIQDYDIHHNIANNINATNNNHNGVFFMQGNGIFHDNKLTNFQGNAIRMWLFSRGTTKATNEIYNNICYNTRKYSGFELQLFEAEIVAGKTTFANAKVYNNTVGLMNTSKDWEGQILDVYVTGGTIEYYNNLGFNLFSSTKPITNMINFLAPANIIKEENNKYFATQAEAVTNLTSFNSLFSNIGAPAQ